MKFYRIFEELKNIEIYVVHYEDQQENEYDRLFNEWTNSFYLYEYAKNNNIDDPTGFINQILEDSEEIEDIFFHHDYSGDELTDFFRPLSDVDIGAGTVLKSKKGKLRRNRLRIYTIQLEKNSFLITGGAIKMSQKMQDHPDTLRELQKLKKVKYFLSIHCVFDTDSLNDFNQEKNDQ